MAKVVYALCALTSAACAIMLIRGWSRSRVRLLLGSALGFVGLALNNVGLVLDMVILTDADLTLWRTLPAVLGMFALTFTLAWDNC